MPDPLNSVEFLPHFIELYRAHPALWQVRSKMYSNRLLKAKGYKELVDLCRTVNPETTQAMVRNKIQNIRSVFKRQLNKMRNSGRSGSGSEDIFVPRLWYFDLLTFTIDQEEDGQEMMQSVHEDVAVENELPQSVDQDDDSSTEISRILVHHDLGSSQLQADNNPSISQLQADNNPSISQLQADNKPSISQLQADNKPSISQLQADNKPSISQLQADNKPSISQLQADNKPSTPQSDESSSSSNIAASSGSPSISPTSCSKGWPNSRPTPYSRRGNRRGLTTPISATNVRRAMSCIDAKDDQFDGLGLYFANNLRNMDPEQRRLALPMCINIFELAELKRLTNLYIYRAASNDVDMQPRHLQPHAPTSNSNSSTSVSALYQQLQQMYPQ